MGDGKVASFVHLFSIHKRESEGFETPMDMHEIKGSDWSSLSNKSDVGRDKVSGVDMIDEDGMVEVVSFSEKMVKGVGELRGKDDCFPFGMVSGGVEMGHGVVEAFMKVGVRGGRS